MARPRKPAPTGASTGRPSAGGDRAFSRRSGGDALTREAIAADLDTFRQAGGKIEVLGITRTLQKIGQDAGAQPPTADPAAAKPRR